MGTGGGMTVGPCSCLEPYVPGGFPSKLVAMVAGKGE